MVVVVTMVQVEMRQLLQAQEEAVVAEQATVLRGELVLQALPQLVRQVVAEAVLTESVALAVQVLLLLDTHTKEK